MRVRLAVLLVVATLLTGCGSADECSVKFELGNAIDYAYVWRDPSTECGMDGTLGSIVFQTGAASLEFRTDVALVVGAHLAEVIYTSPEGLIWTNYLDATTICSVAITSSETVDWVWNDHQRITGNVACSGPLSSLDGEPDLSVTEVSFTIYAAAQGFL